MPSATSTHRVYMPLTQSATPAIRTGTDTENGHEYHIPRQAYCKLSAIMAGIDTTDFNIDSVVNPDIES